MISKKITDELNNQINREFYASYLYLSMATYCATSGFMGFSNWLIAQSKEEIEHAMRIYHYIIKRGGNIELTTIDEPDSEWINLTNVFESALEHEQYITDNIKHLVEISIEEKDYITRNFLNWYLTEQVEEEAQTNDIKKELQFIGDDKNAICCLDDKLSKRE